MFAGVLAEPMQPLSSKSVPATDRPSPLPALTAGQGEARLLAYSAGNFGKNLVFAGADATILFLFTDLFGLPASIAAMLMLVALAGDLIFDLLAAALVIRLRRSGRSYGWLVAVASLPAGAAFALLYTIPALNAEQGWILACTLLTFRGAYAVVDVPHNALMSRISSDSRTRGRISGYRLFFSTAAALGVATILTPAVQQAAHDRTFNTLALIGLAAGTLFALTLIASALCSGDHGDSRESAATDGLAVPLRDPLVLALG